MTSPSRRKHQITASGRRRRTSPDRDSAASTIAIELAETAKRPSGKRIGPSGKRIVSVFSSAILVAVLLTTEIAAAQQQTPEKFARPKRFTPPVHATPIPGQQQYRQQQYQSTAPAAPNQIQNRTPQNRQVRHPQQRPAGQMARHPQMNTGRHARHQQRSRGHQTNANQRFPVRQAAAMQDFDGSFGSQSNGSIGDQPPSFNPPQQQTVDQWRTRNDQAVRDTTDALHSVMQQDLGTNNELHRYSDIAAPDPSMPAMDYQNDGRSSTNTSLPNPASSMRNSAPEYDLPVPRSGHTRPVQPRQTSDQHFLDQQLQNQSGYDSHGQPQTQQRFDAPDMSAGTLTDQAPENMHSDPFDSYITDQPENSFRNDLPTEQSVLVRDQPANNNTLRDLQVEPQRRHNRRLDRNTTMQSRYRSTPAYRNYRQDDDDEDLYDDEEENQARGGKSCEEFRAELLNSPITDIIVDISPRRPSAAAQDIPYGITRTWTDCSGNALGTGTLSSLQRNYIIITNETGASQEIPMSQLSDGDLAIVTEFWVLPNECSLGCYPFEGRQWACSTVFWKASSLCHKPLYFENQQLERYGHTHGPIIQPLHSTAHFFTSLFFYPYNSKINPPNECLYPVGYYRPGDCAPWLKDPFPISLAGAVQQGAVIGVGSAILP